MQTLTEKVLEQGLANRVFTDAQLARIVGGSPQRRYNLVNRALKAGELHQVRRGLYVLPEKYRNYDCHPFALAQMLVPGSYVSLETALAYHGWIPEAVYTTASISPGRKSKNYGDEMLGKFSFHPLAIRRGYFLELVERVTIQGQSMLVAKPTRALMDLACLRKLEWQGLNWLQQNMRVERESLLTITGTQIQTLKLVYKQKRMQRYLDALLLALDASGEQE